MRSQGIRAKQSRPTTNMTTLQGALTTILIEGIHLRCWEGKMREFSIEAKNTTGKSKSQPPPTACVHGLLRREDHWALFQAQMWLLVWPMIPRMREQCRGCCVSALDTWRETTSNPCIVRLRQLIHLYIRSSPRQKDVLRSFSRLLPFLPGSPSHHPIFLLFLCLFLSFAVFLT